METDSRVRDVVKELGFLTLGTRFRRIGESLQAQTQEVLVACGMDLPAAHFPLLAALDRLGPLGVGELSLAVGVSQPVVSRSLLALEASGLVDSASVANDRRVRRVFLNRKGRALIQRAKQTVWPVVEATVAQACEALAGSLLDQLAALEEALGSASLTERVARAAAVRPAAQRRRLAR